MNEHMQAEPPRREQAMNEHIQTELPPRPMMPSDPVDLRVPRTRRRLPPLLPLWLLLVVCAGLLTGGAGHWLIMQDSPAQPRVPLAPLPAGSQGALQQAEQQDALLNRPEAMLKEQAERQRVMLKQQQERQRAILTEQQEHQQTIMKRQQERQQAILTEQQEHQQTIMKRQQER